MDIPTLTVNRRRLFVNRFSEDIENSSECLFSHRNIYRSSGICSFSTSHKTVGAAHGNAAHYVITNMLRNLDNKFFTVIVDFKRILQLRKLSLIKTYVNDRTDNLSYPADMTVL